MYSVFLVDDEELVIKSLIGTVDWSSCGYEVIGYALSGEEALESIEQIQPDVIFSDIRMPGMNGLELKKRLDHAGVSAKFIIVSGLAEFALAQKALQNGIFGYCLKPFDDMEIMGYLKKIKRELDSALLLPEGEILDLIETGSREANSKLRRELVLAGIIRDKTDDLRIMLTVKRDKLVFEGKVPSLTVRIGYRKYIYLMADTSAVTLMSCFSSESQQFLKGIGLNTRGVGTEITQAVREAELHAYQYFTLANNYMWNNIWENKNISLNPSIYVLGNEQAIVAQLNSFLVMFQGDQLDIRHALLLYNDCISLLCRKGKAMDDLYLYSFDQLSDQFEDIREMILYLKQLFRDEPLNSQQVLIQAGRGNSFSAIMEFINEYFNEDITMMGLSKRFKLNPNYISQLFRKELDKTFTEYLTGLRIERASTLLKTTSLPINEIADKVGYKDYFYFSKTFKRIMGVPPKIYRYD